MVWPLWVLAVPTMGFGVTGLRTDWLPALLDGGSLRVSGSTWVIGTGLAVAGVLVCWATWRTATTRARAAADPGRALLGPVLYRWAQHGFGLDRLYSLLFVRPTLGASALVRFLDREVIEGYVQGSGGAARLLGWVVRRAQSGNAQTYLSALLAGAVLIAVFVAVGA
jgi:NADH-quinone oxidoreductase subunit L